MKKENKKYQEGYFIAMGIMFGGLLGIPLSFAIGNPGLIGIGVPIGLILGAALEEKYKKEGKIRPSTEREKRQRKVALIIGLAFGILALLLYLYFILR